MNQKLESIEIRNQGGKEIPTKEHIEELQNEVVKSRASQETMESSVTEANVDEAKLLAVI
jgi:hypothetical protein